MNKKIRQKQETRKRILNAVSHGFRKNGYDGAGVDGLAGDADVTSGAFYAHFGSKAGAFKATVHEDLVQVKDAIEQVQQKSKDDWLKEFIDYYLDEKRCSDLSDSCAMQSFAAEVTRSDDETRLVFETDMLEIVESFTKGLKETDLGKNYDKAWATISILIGGVTLARAVKDPELAEMIAKAVNTASKKL
jgi:AcrR family transcriptional regulator